MNKIYKIKVSLFKSLLIVFTLFFATSCNTDEEQTVATFTNLVMQDEFDTNGSLDNTIWDFNIGTGTNGWGNNELQYYTDRSENAIVQNGVLIITAKKEDFNGAGYTSARILTKGKFEQKYGRFEARIRLPYGQGTWPAFWLLGANIDEVGWPQCGEIDIMENRGQEPTLISGTVHGPGYSAGESIGKSYELLNDRFDTGFHVFGIEWGPEYINFYVDDVLYNQITPEDVTGEWVYDHPFFIILNLAIGGDYVGAPNAETVFPQRMLVDYVRVYQK
ncbi:glycoside hydrolase family 16 protein [uncultured Polaribacter sp.]|uniref:glycoside hydrolase family 16 protein n=1 Tax=uncultured Polaribacter sp. TaxID=174711 RepID=UPI0026117539|nr:glycoside hydrolase family 16 protein [uncultured Polaribacter sp.]